MTLKEIYEKIPEHSKAAIRGNINRYLAKEKNPEFKRVEKGVYSVIEVLKISKTEIGYKINYTASYYANGKEIDFIHKDFFTETCMETGVYQRIDNFTSFEQMENHMSSVKGILIHDDALEALKRLKSESFSLILTDPPYKVISGGSGAKGAPTGMLSKNDGKIFKHNDIKFSDYMGELYRVLKDGSQAYFFTNFLNLQELMEEVQKAGFKMHNLLIWEKNNTTPNRWYMKNCEYVLFCRKGKAKAINDKGSQTVHSFDNILGRKIHETEKPIDLLRMYIKNSTNPGDWILDPFAGSGSSLLASLLEDRRCMTIEIDDLYIPRIKERIRYFLENDTDIRYMSQNC